MVDVGVDPGTGKRKQLRRTFATLKEAKAEYARITNRREEGTFVPPNRITLNEWLDQWLTMKAEDFHGFISCFLFRSSLRALRGMVTC
ncbi:Arm DNA-binding domain-containing protein [Streptomyces sp. NPDC020792]|uniref:Arm DNA-binding domain-containing protein n=1 Tax=Streptomyces sp. NPDC020792 TaxID=3365089 RepID=UPI0037B7B62A